MLWLMRAGSHATRIGSMAFSAHPQPATKVSATRVSAETSEPASEDPRGSGGLAKCDGARVPRVDSLSPTGEHPIHANSDTSDDMVGPALGRLPRYRRPELAHGGSVRQFGLRRLRHRRDSL